MPNILGIKFNPQVINYNGSYFCSLTEFSQIETQIVLPTDLLIISYSDDGNYPQYSISLNNTQQYLTTDLQTLCSQIILNIPTYIDALVVLRTPTLAQEISACEQRLINYYNDTNSWNITLNSNNLNATLTKSQDWFQLNLGSIATGLPQTIQVYGNDNTTYNYLMSVEEGNAVLQFITLTFGRNMKVAFLTAQATINALTDITDVQNFDIPGAFSSVNSIYQLVN